MKDKNTNLNIGKHLKSQRLLAGLTQKELAERIGVNEGTVASYEANRVCPSFPIIIKLADTLNISIDELAGRKC